MLYDPKWEKTQTALTLPNFIAWLERQNPAQTYDYCQITKCAVAQFLKASGAQEISISLCDMPDDIHRVVHPAGSRSPWSGEKCPRGLEWTFGAALKRARAIAAL